MGDFFGGGRHVWFASQSVFRKVVSSWAQEYTIVLMCYWSADWLKHDQVSWIRQTVPLYAIPVQHSGTVPNVQPKTGFCSFKNSKKHNSWCVPLCRKFWFYSSRFSDFSLHTNKIKYNGIYSVLFAVLKSHRHIWKCGWIKPKLSACSDTSGGLSKTIPFLQLFQRDALTFQHVWKSSALRVRLTVTRLYLHDSCLQHLVQSEGRRGGNRLSYKQQDRINTQKH